ncbi:hypothetical protein Tco_0194167 [Tanacetum coccineum]|uniref:Uncharacterized protein n=1 Tax=Tanacetum coccineum TaxID=301880 RepID=A0ABQ5I5P2_9ASTR
MSKPFITLLASASAFAASNSFGQLRPEVVALSKQLWLVGVVCNGVDLVGMGTHDIMNSKGSLQPDAAHRGAAPLFSLSIPQSQLSQLHDPSGHRDVVSKTPNFSTANVYLAAELFQFTPGLGVGMLMYISHLNLECSRTRGRIVEIKRMLYGISIYTLEMWCLLTQLDLGAPRKDPQMAILKIVLRVNSLLGFSYPGSVVTTGVLLLW